MTGYGTAFWPNGHFIYMLLATYLTRDCKILLLLEIPAASYSSVFIFEYHE